MTTFDAETISSAIGNVFSNVGVESIPSLLNGAATAGMGPVGGAAMWTLTACFSAVAQDRAVKGGGLIERKLNEYADSLEDEEGIQVSQAAKALRAITVALPDGDDWTESAVQSANGSPEAIVELLEKYNSDPERRQAFDETIEQVLCGDPANQFNDGEALLDYLQTELGTEDRSETLATFLDVRDLIVSREVHETFEAVNEVSVDLDAARDRIESANNKLDRLLDRDLKNQGFRRITKTYFRLQTPDPLVKAWQTGLSVTEVRAGYAVPREITYENDRLSPGDVCERLRSGEPHHLVVRGKPGSGKSTFCRCVINEWFDRGYGDILHRPSGSDNIDETGVLLDAIRNADGHVLIVTDDAAREESRLVYAVLAELTDVNDVSFLFNARSSEYAEFTPEVSFEADNTGELRALKSNLPTAQMASLTADQCLQVIDLYERHVGQKTGINPEGLIKRFYNSHDGDTDSAGEAGSILRFVYHLTGSAGERTGLENDVIDKVRTIEVPDDDRVVNDDLVGFDSDLRRTAGLLVNFLNAAPGVTPRLIHLHALTTVFDDVDETTISNLVSALDGWLIFEQEGRLEPKHEFWSFLYLRYTVAGELGSDARADRSPPLSGADAHRYFTLCIESLGNLVTDESYRDDLFFELEEEDLEYLERLDADPVQTGDTLIDGLYAIGETRPILAAFYQQHGRSRVDLTEAKFCSPTVAAESLVRVGRMLRKQGNLDAAESILGRAADLTEQRDSRRIEAQRLNQLGNVYRLRGQHSGAERLFTDALELADDVESDRERIRARNYLGVVLRSGNHADREEAEQLHMEALTIAKQADLYALQAETLNNLGWIAEDSGWDFHEQALEIAQACGSRREEAKALRSFGLIKHRRGELYEARKYQTRSLRLYREIGDKESVAWMHNNLSQIAQSEEDFEAASNELKTAIEIFEALSNRRALKMTYSSLADLHREKDAYGKERKCYERLIEIHDELGNRHDRAEACFELGDILRALNEYKKSVKTLQKALKEYDELCEQEMVARTHLRLAQTLNDQEEFERAYEHADRGIEAVNRLEDPPATVLTRLHRTAGIAAAKQGDFRTAKKCFEIGVEYVEAADQPSLHTAMLGELGQVCRMLNEYGIASTVYTNRVERLLDNDDVKQALETLDTLVEVKRADGNIEDAIEACNRALSIINCVDESFSGYRSSFESYREDLEEE